VRYTDALADARGRARMTRHRPVVHVLDDLEVGGAQQLVLTYARHAVRTGVPVTVVSLRPPSDDVLTSALDAAGARVVVLTRRRRPTMKSAPLQTVVLIATLLRLRPRIIQTHLLYSNVIGVMAARLCRLPVVATLHNARVEVDCNSQRAVRLETAVLRRLPTGLVAVGPSVERSQRDRVFPRRLTVVPNAVGPGPLPEQATRARLRSQLAPGENTLLVLAVGRLVPAKGYDDLLTAFKRILRAVPNAVLAIAGDGPEYARMRNRLDGEGLTDAVLLLRQRDDVRDLLGAADLFVSASHWEGLPVALLEAMSAGLPVVVTAVGDVPAAIGPDGGVLVQPGEPVRLAAEVVALLQDHSRREALGRAAASRVREHFTVERWVAALDRVFDDASGVPPKDTPVDK